MRRPRAGYPGRAFHPLRLGFGCWSFPDIRYLNLKFLPSPHRPATIPAPLLRAAPQLHILDPQPPRRAVQVTDVPAHGPEIGGRRAAGVLVAEITANLDRPVPAMRHD